MTATPPPVSPVRETFRATPALAALKLHDGTSVGQALDAAPVLSIERTDAGGFSRLVGGNDAGAALLDSDAGTGLNRIFGTLYNELDAPAQQALQGVRLTNSGAQLGLNWTITRFENEAGIGNPVPAPTEFAEADVQRWVADDQASIGVMPDQTPADRHADLSWAGPWVTFGPRTSAGLLDIARQRANTAQANEVLKVALHEFEHTRSPSPSSQWTDRYLSTSFRERMDMPFMDQIEQIAPVNWIEEASATILTRWAGRLAGVVDKTGAGVPYAPTPEPDYTQATSGLSRLLRLAGLDEGLPADRSRADEVLQQRDLADVPHALAQAIASEQGIKDATAVAALSERIRNATTKLEVLTDPDLVTARIDAIEEFVREKASTDRGR